ncbi:MAG: hypothetical protein OHK003_01910 [Anaerolineales bacterium]
MKTKRFVFSNFISLILIAAFIAGCGSKPAVEMTPRLQEIKDSGQLVIGTALTAPFEYHDQKTGGSVWTLILQMPSPNNWA